MKMTNAQMMSSLHVLAGAEEKGVLGFAIAQNRRKLATEVESYSAKYDEIVRKHGTDLGDGRFSIDKERLADFEAELRPYAEMTTDVSVIQVSAEVFCSGELTSSQMLVLEWMVKEGD